MMTTTTKFVRYVIEQFTDKGWQPALDGKEFESLGAAQVEFHDKIYTTGWNMDDWRFVRVTKSVQREVL